MLLADVYEAKYGSNAELTKERLEPLAEILTNIVERDTPWTWTNLRNIIKGYSGFLLTSELHRACEIYANELEGQSTFQARLQQKVFWTSNNFHPDTIIHGEGLTCARPGCNIKFIKTNPAMKYCPMHRVK